MTGFLRILLVSALSGAALVAAGCGDRHEGPTLAQVIGSYLDVGHLTYQVQISRPLNRFDPEDSAYLTAVPEDERELEQGEAWFGVFLRVQNTEGEEVRPMAEDIVVADTQDNVYEPIDIDPELNNWVYLPTSLDPDELYPPPNTPAAEGPTGGALLLYKITVDSMQARPLQLHVRAPEDPDEVGIINLDI